MDIPLPKKKICLPSDASHAEQSNSPRVILVATGSFNPPTFMHLRMFELARDHLRSEGYNVIAGYISPVNDAYKKPGLISSQHRIALCELACESSDFVMVDPWEANQSSYQRTLTILQRIQSSFIDYPYSLKVMLLCGSDLLQSFSVPGVWIREQVISICRDFGVICIRREGLNIEEVVRNDDVLCRYKGNIRAVDDSVPSFISSSRLRNCIARGLSVKYLTFDDVISYVQIHNLYKN